MTTKFAPSRIVGSLALACALAGACATGNAPSSAAGASPSTDDRDSVVRCYANSYRKKTGVGPVLDDKTDKAAEQLLAKYKGDPKKSCEVIAAAFSSSACSGATLSAVSRCDDHAAGRDPNNLDPTTKAQLETQVRDRESRGTDSQRGY